RRTACSVSAAGERFAHTRPTLPSPRAAGSNVCEWEGVESTGTDMAVLRAPHPTEQEGIIAETPNAKPQAASRPLADSRGDNSLARRAGLRCEGERILRLVEVHRHRSTVGHVALEQQAGQRRLDFLLNRPLQRPRAVRRVVPGPHNVLLRGV